MAWVRWTIVAALSAASLGGCALGDVFEEGTEWMHYEHRRKEDGETQWVRQAKGPRDEALEAVSLDRDGNALALINFLETTTIARKRITGSAEQFTLLVVKLDRGGKLLWTRTFPGRYGTALVADTARDVWIGSGRFLAKLDKEDGDVQWERSFAGEGDFLITHLAADPWNRVVMLGQLNGSLTDITCKAPLVSAGTAAVLARFETDGQAEWAALDPTLENPQSIAADNFGRIVAGGSTMISGLPRPTVRQYEGEGDLRWERTLETAVGLVRDVATHGDRVLGAGSFELSFEFRGEQHTADNEDAFVIAYTREGEERWARNFGFHGLAMAMDQRDGVLVGGTYDDGDDLGLGPVAGVPSGESNLFVLKLDRIDGDPRWVRGFPTEASQIDDVDLSRFGEALVGGRFSFPVDFGTGALTPEAGYDAFVLKLGR
jgi:hypothetical protein